MAYLQLAILVLLVTLPPLTLKSQARLRAAARLMLMHVELRIPLRGHGSLEVDDLLNWLVISILNEVVPGYSEVE